MGDKYVKKWRGINYKKGIAIYAYLAETFVRLYDMYNIVMLNVWKFSGVILLI